MAAEIFLDTGYAVALSSPSDLFHRQALALAREIVAKRLRLVTTRAVALEIANALSRRRFRAAGVKLLDSLEADPNVTILPLTEQEYARAFALYRQRMDKEWGITDCLSFLVMQDRKITDALTPDVHFRQVGFRALMRDVKVP